jgi:AbiJ-like protein
VDKALGKRVIEIRKRIVDNFDHGNWEELGLLTGTWEVIEGHDRLLRSLAWGDEDYAGNVLTMVRWLGEQSPGFLSDVTEYLDTHFPGESTYVSAKPSQRRITFSPDVFEIPNASVESNLVAVMMPFSMEFDAVYTAIQGGAAVAGLRCLRADDVWEESTIVQDIFNLIFRAHVVVVDFTGKNPNVMYETGIAHTLGKLVVPISQSLDDVPFDMRHHRVLTYLANKEGLAKLSGDLEKKLRQVGRDSVTLGL